MRAVPLPVTMRGRPDCGRFVKALTRNSLTDQRQPFEESRLNTDERTAGGIPAGKPTDAKIGRQIIDAQPVGCGVAREMTRRSADLRLLANWRSPGTRSAPELYL